MGEEGRGPQSSPAPTHCLLGGEGANAGAILQPPWSVSARSRVQPGGAGSRLRPGLPAPQVQVCNSLGVKGNSRALLASSTCLWVHPPHPPHHRLAGLLQGRPDLELRHLKPESGFWAGLQGHHRWGGGRKLSVPDSSSAFLSSNSLEVCTQGRGWGGDFKMRKLRLSYLPQIT